MKARQSNPDDVLGRRLFQSYRKSIRDIVEEEIAKPEVKNRVRHFRQELLEYIPAISFSGFEKDRLYYNLGGRFEDLGPVLGAARIEDGRAFVMFDFDRDGDLDILMHNFYKHPFVLLRNESKPGRWIEVRGRVGARVRVETTKGTLVREIVCGSGYLTGTPPSAFFALGDAEVTKVTVDGAPYEAKPFPKAEALEAKPSPAPRSVHVGDTLSFEASDLKGGKSALPPDSIVYVFHPDCYVCREEFKRWKEIPFRDAKVVLVCLSSDVEDVTQFLTRYGATQRCLLAGDAPMDRTTPIAYVTDARGKVAAKFAGRHALADALKWR